MALGLPRLTRASRLLLILAVIACWARPVTGEDTGAKTGATLPTVGNVAGEVAAGQPGTWFERAIAEAKARHEPAMLIIGAAGLAGRTPSGAPLVDAIKVPAAQDAVLDAALGVVWLRTDDELSVVDLRTRTPAPVPIVRGRLSSVSMWIAMHTKYLEYLVRLPSTDSCKPGWRLEWTTTPVVEPVHGTPPGPKPELVGMAWLQANHLRKAKWSPQPQDFWPPGHVEWVKLPDQRGCTEASECGRALVLGKATLRLVLVRSSTKAGCEQHACLLYDTKAKRWATPPPAGGPWGPFAEAKPGACGPYQLDRTQQWFLSDNKICRVDGACEDLGGRALGWLLPEAIVGTPQ